MTGRRKTKRWKEGGRWFERQGMLIQEVVKCPHEEWVPRRWPSCGCSMPSQTGEPRAKPFLVRYNVK